MGVHAHVIRGGHPVLPGRKVVGARKSCSMRRSAHTEPTWGWAGSPWVSALQLLALEKRSSPTAHPFSTSFCCLDVADWHSVVHTIAVSFSLVPEVSPYIPELYEEDRADEVEAEVDDSANKAADAPTPPHKKVRKADDAAAPGSPGAEEVRVITSMVKSSAQKVVAAKRVWKAAATHFKKASSQYDAKLEYIEKQWKRKLTDARARNLEKKLDLATSNLKAAKLDLAEVRAGVLEAKMGVLCYQVALRDAKLRSLQRRLRRRRIFGMWQW